MKELFQYIRRKLSIKVSLWVVLFAAIIFVVALGFLFVQSRDAVRKEAINHATQILDKTSLRVEGILNRAEVATNMTTWLAAEQPRLLQLLYRLRTVLFQGMGPVFLGVCQNRR